MNGATSSPLPASGVYTILGPLFFLIYINDFTNLPLSSFSQIIIYADDICIFKPIDSPSSEKKAKRRLGQGQIGNIPNLPPPPCYSQSDLDLISFWLSSHYLKLNSSKSICTICFSPINLLLILTHFLFSLYLTLLLNVSLSFTILVSSLPSFLGIGTYLKYITKLVKSLVSSFVTFTSTLLPPPLLDSTILLCVLFLILLYCLGSHICCSLSLLRICSRICSQTFI